MKKSAIVLLSLALAACAGLFASACTSNSVPSDANPIPDNAVALDNGAYVVVDNTIEMWLDCNPTTGFDWVLEVGSGAEIALQEYISTESSPVAAGGGGLNHYIFTFSGDSDINFVYMQPWEDMQPEDTAFNMFVSCDGSTISNVEFGPFQGGVQTLR